MERNIARSRSADLETVLETVASVVNPRKLKQLTTTLEAALDHPLSAQELADPAVIRRQMVEHLRSRDVSRGMIQSLEQFFMGIVRRAAVDGLVPAPPEGPWTRAWQSALDLSSEVPGTKAPLRALAAWATVRHLEPGDVGEERLRSWAEETFANEEAIPRLQDLLAEWSPSSLDESLDVGSQLSERLLSKAARGTVGVDPDSKRTI